MLLASTALCGVLMMLVETYWQPRFTALLPADSLLWLLGLLGFGYFAASIFGSLAAERAVKRLGANRIFLLGYALSAVCLLALSAVRTPAGFSALYLMLYLLMGAADTAQGIAIHRATPSAVRATVLSGQGLTLQLGALSASGAAGLTAGRLSIPALWQLGAVLFLLGIAAVALLLKRPPGGAAFSRSSYGRSSASSVAVTTRSCFSSHCRSNASAWARSGLFFQPAGPLCRRPRPFSLDNPLSGTYTGNRICGFEGGRRHGTMQPVWDNLRGERGVLPALQGRTRRFTASRRNTASRPRRRMGRLPGQQGQNMPPQPPVYAPPPVNPYSRPPQNPLHAAAHRAAAV